MGKRISVVLPTYNGEKYIGEALESAFAQTLPPFEVIVVDDGSTDDTGKIVGRYGDRVRYIAQTNRGVAGAYNTGIAAATGDLVAFLEHDDLWAPEKNALQVQAFERQHVGLVFCPVSLLAEGQASKTNSLELDDGEGLYGFADFFKQNRILNCSTVMIKRGLLSQVGGFREDLRLGFDYDLWLRVLAHCNVFSVPEPLVTYRIHGGNLSRDAHELLAAQGNLQTMLRWVGDPVAERAVGRKAIQTRVAALYKRVAWDYVKLGMREEELRHLWEAVKVNPSDFRLWSYFTWRRLDPGIRGRLAWYGERISRVLGKKGV